jgi:hypothetical protein
MSDWLIRASSYMAALVLASGMWLLPFPPSEPAGELPIPQTGNPFPALSTADRELLAVAIAAPAAAASSLTRALNEPPRDVCRSLTGFLPPQEFEQDTQLEWESCLVGSELEQLNARLSGTCEWLSNPAGVVGPSMCRLPMMLPDVPAGPISPGSPSVFAFARGDRATTSEVRMKLNSVEGEEPRHLAVLVEVVARFLKQRRWRAPEGLAPAIAAGIEFDESEGGIRFLFERERGPVPRFNLTLIFGEPTKPSSTFSMK